jgi:23S rRNA (adenine2503-C2)-methyltransferase
MALSAPTRPQLPGIRVEALAQILGSRTRANTVLRQFYETGDLPDALPEKGLGVRAESWNAMREQCDWTVPQVTDALRAPDHTVKRALRFADGAEVESVLIPARGRSTVCISSQAGCTRNCGFCATAQLGFRRNLTASEMVAQFIYSRQSAPQGSPARNVVFMGMGEPMDNLDAVLEAIDILTQTPAPSLSAAHITVSTSGVVPGMRRFLRESRAQLALSLNGSSDAQRAQLMPQTRTWPIAALLEVLREEAVRHPKRNTFIEYVLFEGINDSDQDADRLAKLLEGLPVRVNLIPHNAFPGSPLRPPSKERIREFQNLVHRLGLRCMVRWPRGGEIAAACGQLARPSAAGL